MTAAKVPIQLVVVALVAAAFVFVSGRPAHTCSCVQAMEQQHLEAADVVFRGIATAVPDRDTVEDYVSTFSVEETFKGGPGAAPKVRTAGSSAACGLEFTRGGRYLVFAREQGDLLTANLCGGTRTAAAGDAPAIGPPAPPPGPVPPAQPPNPVVGRPRFTG